MLRRIFMVVEILNLADQPNSTIWFRLYRLLDRPENSTHQSLVVRTLIKNSFEAVLTTGIRVLWCQSLSTWKLKWSKSQKLVSPLIFRLYLLNHNFLDFNIQISDFTSYRNVQIKKLVCNRLMYFSKVHFRSFFFVKSNSTTKNQKRIIFCNTSAFPILPCRLIEKRISFQIGPFLSFDVKCFEVGSVASPAVGIIQLI